MDETKVTKTGKIFEDYAGAVGREIVKSLQDSVPKLSEDSFSALEKYNANIEWALISQKCESKIRQQISEQMQGLWHELGLKVAILEWLKRRTKNKATKQWRPYNKTPLEQCQPYIQEILKGKNYFLECHLKEQRSRLEKELVPAIEMHRSNIKAIMEKQEELMAKMKGMNETNEVLQNRLEAMQKKLIYLKCINRGVNI